MLLKTEISYSFVCVRSGWRRPKVAAEFLSLQLFDVKLTCGVFWHLRCVDERQQITVWTEIAGGITGAANGGQWNLESQRWKLLPLWPWLGHCGQGRRRIPLSPVLVFEPVVNSICRRLSSSGKDFFSCLLCKAGRTTR